MSNQICGCLWGLRIRSEERSRWLGIASQRCPQVLDLHSVAAKRSGMGTGPDQACERGSGLRGAVTSHSASHRSPACLKYSATAAAASPASNSSCTRPADGGHNCARACSATYEAIWDRHSCSLAATVAKRAPSTPDTMAMQNEVCARFAARRALAARAFPDSACMAHLSRLSEIPVPTAIFGVGPASIRFLPYDVVWRARQEEGARPGHLTRGKTPRLTGAASPHLSGACRRRRH